MQTEMDRLFAELERTKYILREVLHLVDEGFDAHAIEAVLNAYCGVSNKEFKELKGEK